MDFPGFSPGECSESHCFCLENDDTPWDFKCSFLRQPHINVFQSCGRNHIR